MRRLTLLGICSVIGLFMFVHESHAQLVRVYGARVDVRAPFVRIYSAPHGGTVYHTPFGVRAVEQRPPRFSQPAAPEELPPPPALNPDPRSSNHDQQRSRLAASAQGLAESLKRFANGAQWHEYLRLSEQISPDGEADVVALTTALERLAAIRQNPQYRELTSLPGFEATYRDLSAYLRFDRDQQRRHQLPQPPPQQFQQGNESVDREPTPRDDYERLLTRMAR